MRLPAVISMLAIAAPVAAQQPTILSEPSRAQSTAQVRVTTRIVTIDRDALTRAGLSYVLLGNDRVRVGPIDGRSGRAGRAGRRERDGRGVGIEVGIHGVTAFLEAARESRWVRSEATQQVLTMAGRPATVSSQTLGVGRRAARTRGPTLAVFPTVLEGGRVLLRLSTAIEDRVTYAWGYGVDGSPAAVDTEVVARDGEELIIASSAFDEQTRESGILHWSSGERGRDVLVAVTAEVVGH